MQRSAFALRRTSNSASASSSISLLGMSRWFVGSSSSSSEAGVTMNFASARRAFSPPDRNSTFLCCASPLKPILPSSDLMSAAFMSSPAACSSVPSTVRPRSSASAWFCAK